MKKLTSILVLAAALVSAQSWASILTLDKGPNSIENVNIGTVGTVNLPNQAAISLTELGAGVRYEPVALFNIKVYVGQLLISGDTKVFDTTESDAQSVKSLNSLDNVSVVAIQMNFVHDVTVGQQLSAYNTGFDDNLVPVATRLDPTTKQIVKPGTNALADAMKAFEDAVKKSGPISSGQAQVVVFQKLSDGTEAVTFEGASGQAQPTVTGPKGFNKAVLSAWIGIQSNSGVAAIKKDFITGRKK